MRKQEFLRLSVGGSDASYPVFRRFGPTIPPSILARADEVIQ